MDKFSDIRLTVAKALRIAICGPEHHDVMPTDEQYRHFFQSELGSREPATSGNYKIFGYSASSAKQALGKILQGETCWRDGIGSGSDARFESELIKYIRSMAIEGIDRIPSNFFRHGFDGRQDNFADNQMIIDGNEPEYIVSQLFDICAKIQIGKSLLDSPHLKGIFIVAAVKLDVDDDLTAIGSITFADLFDSDINFNPDRIDFGQCTVKNVSRIDPQGKPYISKDEFIRHIYRVYDRRGSSRSSQGFVEFQSTFLENCIRLIAKITQKYLEPLQDLMDSSIGCGRLPRVLLDVEHGAVMARQVDQGRLWVLAISPVQDTVDECDELFGRAITLPYEQALRTARSRRV